MNAQLSGSASTAAAAAHYDAKDDNANGGFLMIVFNPLSRPRQEGVRVPVDATHAYTVTGGLLPFR
jgi:hypothetical protein